MSLEAPLAIAISGLNASALRANVAANNIANANTPGFKAGEVRTTTIVTVGSAFGGVSGQVFEGGNVDVAMEFTRLIRADIAYRAAARIVSVSEDMARTAVDIVA